MAQAIRNGKVIAESDRTEIVEGNHYFPAEAVKTEYLKESDHHTVCSWKGTASYYNLEVDGQVNENAVWYYPDPKKGAEQVAGRIAFWRGVRVES